MLEFQQLSIFDVMYENYKITKPIRLIELFAGIGSQAKALKNIGANFETYKVVEFDKYAVASYNEIHNTNFNTLDITQISGDDLEIKDTDKYDYIMTYSFPCQDLSLAGKQKGMSKGTSTRSGLLWEVERLLKECKELPQILLMENVPQVHSKDNINDFNMWINFLDSLGYRSYWKDLNSLDFGIPQNRNRTFMISILGNYSYNFPKKQNLSLRLIDLLDNDVDEKYFLSHQCILKLDKYLPKNCVFNFSPTLTTELAHGTGKNFYPKIYKIFIYHCKIPRLLTPKECFRLMGFSDEDYENASRVNSNTQLYKQIANSIVVNVLMEIFKMFII